MKTAHEILEKDFWAMVMGPGRFRQRLIKYLFPEFARFTDTVRGYYWQCGEEFFTDSENYGTDESLCYECLEERERENDTVNPAD